MKIDDLVKQYPWADRPLIRAYADQFNQSEWKDMDEAGVPQFLITGILDDLLVTAFFDSIHALAQMPEMIQLMESNQLSFKQLVSVQIQQVTKAASEQTFARPAEVLEWLGPALVRRVEQEVTSYNMMDNIVQALSSRTVRDILSGDRNAIHALPVIPPALAALKGQDARVLMRNHQMTLSQLLDCATQLVHPIARQLPDWIEDNLELRALANKFTDQQLDELGKVLVVSIRNDRELKCGFLRSILLETCINGQQKIHECTDVTVFKQLVLTRQKSFLEIAKTQAAQFHTVDAITHSAIPVFDSVSVEPANNYFIRKYVAEYKNPHVPIPTDTVRRQEALACALRNAANAGQFWDLLILIHDVSNINACGLRSGKSALHFAASYASRTGDRLCFDMLANRKEIDFSIRDKDNKTALDLWDFEKCPDEALMEKRTLQDVASLSIHSPNHSAAEPEEHQEKPDCCVM